MTNPPSSGGMPKWLIILLVILLVIIVGCCGGVTMCWHYSAKYGGKVVGFGEEKAKEQLQKSIADEKKRIDAAETQRAEDLKRQAQIALPPNDPTRTNAPQENTTPTPGNNTTGGSGAAADPAVKTTKMPTTFPEDIPVYQGFVPTFAIDDKIHSAGTVILAGTDKVDAISDFYAKQLADKGWTIDTNMTISGNAYQTYSKDTRKAAITITSDGAKTQIAITYGPK